MSQSLPSTLRPAVVRTEIIAGVTTFLAAMYIIVVNPAILANAGMPFNAVLIPLTFSVTRGILWSFLTWSVIKIAIGKFREVSPTLLVIDALAVLSFVV